MKQIQAVGSPPQTQSQTAKEWVGGIKKKILQPFTLQNNLQTLIQNGFCEIDFQNDYTI